MIYRIPSSSASWRLGARLSLLIIAQSRRGAKGEGADLPQRLGVLARGSLSYRAKPQRRKGGRSRSSSASWRLGASFSFSSSRRAAKAQRGKEQIFLSVLASWREALFLIAQSRKGAKGEGADLPQRLGVLARGPLSFHRAKPQRGRPQNCPAYGIFSRFFVSGDSTSLARLIDPALYCVRK